MIIAITAPKGSGKDLTADYIAEKYSFKKIAYANHLKEILRRIFNFSDKELYGEQADKEQINGEWNISSRQAALAFGDFMRYTIPEKYPKFKEKTGSNFFVDYLINYISKSSDNFVISDVRFNNEIVELRNAFPNKKILLIRLKRTTSGFNKETDNHHSENPDNLDPNEINITIENNGTINDLYTKIHDSLINFL
jgi:hypothetical protein